MEVSSIRTISWNVSGIKARQDDIKQLVATLSPDLICLQKTRTGAVPPLNGYVSFSACDDRWSGVLTYYKQCVTCRLIEEDTHHQVLDLGDIILINAYVPYSNSKLPDSIARRKEWDEWLHDFVAAQAKPVIICGDLNIVHTDLDTFYPSCVRNTGCYHPWERENFNRLLTDGKLVDSFRDLHPNEQGYTYFDTMHGTDYRALNEGSRLDYFLVSNLLLPYVQKSEILPSLSAPSNPIYLELRLPQSFKR